MLTEHTKPAQSGYMLVLGWFDPMKHETQMDIDAIKERIAKGAQPSNRVAKLAKKQSWDTFFDNYITLIDRKRKKKNGEDEEEVTETAAEESTTEETPEEEKAE